jgi:hypothetical protein
MKSPLFSVALIRDKYLLHIINKKISVICLLRDLLYIYKCKNIINLTWIIHVIILEVEFLSPRYSRPEM